MLHGSCLQEWLNERSRAHDKSEFRAPCARARVLLSSLFARGSNMAVVSRGQFNVTWVKTKNCTMCVVISVYKYIMELES